MTTDTISPRQERQKTKVIYKGASSAPVYGLGLIGALGILKGIVWPAMLVYELLKYLSM